MWMYDPERARAGHGLHAVGAIWGKDGRRPAPASAVQQLYEALWAHGTVQPPARASPRVRLFVCTYLPMPTQHLQGALQRILVHAQPGSRAHSPG